MVLESNDSPTRFTRAEVAKILRISLGTLDKRIREGEISTTREGKRVFVKKAELERYLAR